MLTEYIFYFILIFLIPLTIIKISAILLRKFGVPPKKVIVLSFLIFGFLIGLWSSRIGKQDIVFVTNIPGIEPSERVYNQYLIPYWQRTLKPTGYEETPIINLETGQRTGTERVPQYNFPIKNVSLLYIPFSILSWGLIGLFFQVVYNKLSKS